MVAVAAAFVVACGGEVVADTDAGFFEAGDGPGDHAPRNACEGLDGRACQLAGCLALTAPECDAPLPDGGIKVTHVGCVPRLECVDDSGCPADQRCLYVLYSKCPPGVACTSDGTPRCQGRKLCVYSDFP